MLHIDIPTRTDLELLLRSREPASVSIYVPTTPVDIVDIARAATFGAVDTVLVDMDEVVSGFVDEESGAVTLTETGGADDYGVVDEIARRAFLTGARVLAVRRDDIPGKGSVAAILRFAI